MAKITLVILVDLKSVIMSGRQRKVLTKTGVPELRDPA